MSSQTATTFRVSDKTPEKHYSTQNKVNTGDRENLIKQLTQYNRNHCTEVLQSTNFPVWAIPSNNGFVDTVVECYNRHHNLVIRPDDIWATIMTQFSFYINNHAEEFRGKFVDFEGKRELQVSFPGSLRNAPYDLGVKLLTKEIDRNLIDPEVKKWIMPSFSTTTDNDVVSIGVVFMASMKKYFDYKMGLLCGIPNVTLEGAVDDWENIHSRLEKLKEYKLDNWYDMLEPIMKQFVDAKNGKVDLDFWQRICHYSGGGSGPRYLSGWLTAFCVFDKDGNWQGSRMESSTEKWLKIDTNAIPSGIVEVDVKINDNGAEYNTIMFAGHVATEVKDDGCTLQPTLGWAIALKSD
ncbi:hypothetical protein Ocin01_16066 [Orchesella cincta]|uniref:DUF4419 domain-containing protein n=1 Tax=Orchesella cincta TaxID=48709 RepID=A0A1D2MCB4_ORCCI|nr:hypothetical protein Ocin01_16066 [Orchesella cincta]